MLIEAESAEEISEALKAFRDAAAAADRRFMDNTDSEYWFCVGFQNRAQKEEFLKKLGLFDHGDKYLDGVYVAQKLGITLETPTPQMPRFGHDVKLARLAPDLDEPYPKRGS